MVYLKNFSLLSERQEHDILYYEETRQIYNNNYYPLHLFSQKEFKIISLCILHI